MVVLEYGMEFEYLFGVQDEIPDITRSSGMVRRIRFIYRKSYSKFGNDPVHLWQVLEGSRTCHKCTGSFPNLEYDFLYMNLILRTIPELLVMSGISSWTPNKYSNSIPYSSTTISTSNFKCVTLRFVNYADMVEYSLRPITNSGIWRSIMAPTYP